MKWYNGYIKWYDHVSGTGVVRIPSLKADNSIFVHFSSDIRLNKYKSYSNKLKHRYKIKYNNMDQVRCTVFFDSHFIQIDKIKPHKWIKYEDLVSDILLNYFESLDNLNIINKSSTYLANWDDYILNNILDLTERKNK